MFEFGFKGLAALLLAGLLAASCHSAASMSAFEAASGKPNTVATPTIGVAPGWYPSDQSVGLSCATSGSTIMYSTDGTTAPALGSTYSSALHIVQNTTLQAQGFKSGFPSSAVLTAVYQIGVYPIEIYYHSTLSGTDALLNSLSTTVGQDGYLWFKASAASQDAGGTSKAATVYYNTIGDSTANLADPTSTSSTGSWTTSNSSPQLPLAGNGAVLHVKTLGTHSGLSDSSVTDRTVVINYVGGLGAVPSGPVSVTIASSGSLTPSSAATYTAGATVGGIDVASSCTFVWYINGTLASILSDSTLWLDGAETNALTLHDTPVGYYTLNCVVTYKNSTYTGTITVQSVN